MKFFTGLAFLVLSLNANAAFITFNQSNLSGHGAQATSGGFNVTNGGLVFNFGGTQNYGNQDFARPLSANVWYNITIDFSDYDLTGFDRMLFIADQDQAGRSTTSNFRNLLVTTPSNVVDVPAPGAALMLALALVGIGFTARRKL